MAIIYLLTNTSNGKMYVGKTTRSLEERWSEHVKSSCYGSELYVHRAIRKYGESSFDVSVIEECSSDAINEREIYWIDRLNTLHEGYNMTAGGDGMLEFKHSKESIEANRLAHINKTQSTQTCDRRRKSMFSSDKVKRKRVVMIMNDGTRKEFLSACEAERYIKKPGSATLISRCCKGKTRTAYGHEWIYAVNQQDLRCRTRKPAIKRQVVQVDFTSGLTVCEYKSAAAAARALQRNPEAIRLCCHGKLETAYGFVWKFDE